MSDELNEDPNKTVDEMLDWLCWRWATIGEQFYPPDETAEECVADYTDDEYEKGSEYGEHLRAFTSAADVFDDLQVRGFDPVGRTERHIEEAREEGLDLPDADWTWWEDWNGEQ